MILNISKRNPLNAIYNYWITLGGEPKTPEDLCHFMRVCFLWSWVRWLFSFDFEITERQHGYVTGHYHRDRFPRFVFFLVATVAVIIVTELIATGRLVTVFQMLAFLFFSIIFAYGLIVATGKVAKSLEGSDVHEGLKTFKEYASAKKQRICPFIRVVGENEVEK